MKFPARPENLTERIALSLGLLPMPMVDTLFPMIRARALVAGVRLKIFETLAAGPLDSAALASRIGADEENLAILLKVIAAAGYLASGRNGYRLTREARRTLVAGAPADCRGFVEFNCLQWKLMERLETSVLTGHGADFHRALADEDDWRVYQRAMLDIAAHTAPILARRVPVRSGATRLLDVAGSHGLLGAAICRRHPPMRSVVIDLPAALPHARALAEEAGIAGIVTHQPGDVLTGGFADGQDVVLLANILHHFAPAQSREILRRAHDAMVPGGTVAIWEIEKRADDKPPELLRDVSSLIFRLSSTSGTFTAADYADWLRDAGFESIRTARSIASPIHVLVHARKPPA